MVSNARVPDYTVDCVAQHSEHAGKFLYLHSANNLA